MFQAAVASLQADQKLDWIQIAALNGELVRVTGSAVAELNRAVAVAEVQGPEAALQIVDRLDLDNYQYLHATRGELLRRLGRADEAVAAYRELLADPAAAERLVRAALGLPALPVADALAALATPRV